jgi:hypothetical protein
MNADGKVVVFFQDSGRLNYRLCATSLGAVPHPVTPG